MSFIVQPQTLFAIGPSRTFGGISGYVTLTEGATDSLTITKSPVQQGASIADHAFKNPVAFSIQMKFSPSLTKSLATIYRELLDLQSTFVPFTCITPKRTYNNCLFATLTQTTDKLTENCLSISASFEQIIIVPIVTANVPRSQLSNAGSNGGTQPAGKKSALAALFGGPPAGGGTP